MGSSDGRRRRSRRPSSCASAGPTSPSSTSAARRSRACPARASSTCRSRPSRTTSRASSRCSTSSASGRSRGPIRGRRRGRCRSARYELDGKHYRIHLHVQPVGGDYPRDIAFRDALRNDPELRRSTRSSSAGSPTRRRRRRAALHAFEDRLDPAASTGGSASRRRRSRRPRRSGSSAAASSAGCSRSPARELGYRVAVLDPDPDAPAASIADRIEVAAYDDVAAAQRLADGAARSSPTSWSTCGARGRRGTLDDRRAGAIRPARPVPAQAHGRPARRTALRRGQRGPVAEWREVTGPGGRPRGRRASSAIRCGSRRSAAATTAAARSASRARPDVESLDGRIGWPALLERELAFEAELSVVVVRNVDGISRTFPVARNRHDRGILVETVVPAGLARGGGGGRATTLRRTSRPRWASSAR